MYFSSEERKEERGFRLGSTPSAMRNSYVNSSSRQVFGLVYRNYNLMRRQLSGERNTHRRDTLTALLDIIEVFGKVQNYIMKALEYLQDIPTHIHPQPPSIFGGSNSQVDYFLASVALLYFIGSDQRPRISIDMVQHLHAYRVIRALTQQSEQDVGVGIKNMIAALDFRRI